MSRWGVGIGTTGAVTWYQRLDEASARPALASARCRSMARYTVERPTPKSSATSAMLYSPVRTRETRCASWPRLSLGCLPRRRPLALATFMPSRVRSRIRSDSNSATMARTFEQQPPDRVSGVIDGRTQGEADLPAGQLVGNRSGVGQGPGKSVELGHHQGVAGAAGGECLTESGSLAVGAGQAVIDVDPVGLDAQAEQGFAVCGEILLIGGATGVPDKQRTHGAPPKVGPGRAARTRTARASAVPDSVSTHLLRLRPQ